MIDNDMCIRATPVYDGGTIIAMRKECVITKEEFIECYNTWVKENNAKHCNTCVHYQQLTKIQELGYCEIKNYHVSANSDKCITYKEKQ